MYEAFGTPIHPGLVHFPIAGTIFAVLALLIALKRPDPERRAWRDGGTLLLLAALLSTPLVVLSGRGWAASKGHLPEGALLPPPEILEGALRQHAILANVGATLLAGAFAAAVLARRGRSPLWLAAVLSVAAAAVIAYTSHIGGLMVHGG